VTGQGMSGIVLAGGAAAHREPTPVAVERPADQSDPADAVPSAAKVIDAADGPLPLPLPLGTALLRVTRRPYDGQECFYLELQCDTPMRSTPSSQDLRSQGRPDLTLADVAVKHTWRQSFHALRSWSVNKLTLRQWLTALRRRHGRRLRLIIWDETDFQIPWELFFHETDDPDDHGWLGADVEIIRWTTVYSETPIDWSTGGSSTCRGSILSFTDQDFPSPEPLLSRYRYEPTGSMEDLLTKLDDTDREVGLVYVWGHGRPGPNGETATLAGISHDRLGVYLMRALRGSRTLVLLNACGSAQLMNDNRFGEKATRSFAEIFLRRGARGVIATSGEVGKADSYDLVSHLVFAAEEADVNLPAMLLKYRAALAHELPTDPGDDPAVEERLKFFFYGFMYLYFGHPDTMLRMLPVGAAG
jgi:hypothetical protein